MSDQDYSDPLSFKFLSEGQLWRDNVIFVDIDYEKLMRQKCNIIRSTKQLSELVSDDANGSQSDPVLLRSSHYVAVACDLSDINTLQNVMNSLNLEARAVLFVAEVSMTYMEVQAADNVIKMTSQFPYGQFCLLEQWMPDGPNHPFASTMIKHFEKLNSPLRSPMKYPDSDSLRERFQTNGWKSVETNSLWDLWSDETFITSSERAALDQIEQFDEWEEFALFGSHYFLLTAHTQLSSTVNGKEHISQTSEPHQEIECKFSPYIAVEQLHRYSAQFKVGRTLVCHGGLATRGRTSNTFLYSIDKQHELSSRDTFSNQPFQFPELELMCHTTTTFRHGEVMLVGGRTAPHLVSKRCFILRQNAWQQIADLPEGRYRHSAVSVNTISADSSSTSVLVFGGRNSTSQALDSWLLLDPSTDQWQQLEVLGEVPNARFSAAMSVDIQCSREGHLGGGIGAEGTVLDDLWNWELVFSNSSWKIICTRSPLMKVPEGRRSSFCRAGASLIEDSTALYLIGGVAGNEFISGRRAMTKIDKSCGACTYEFSSDIPIPLLVGHSVENAMNSQGEISFSVTGGGAVCFSFGTFWNPGSYCLSTGANNFMVQPWMVLSGKATSGPGSRFRQQIEPGIPKGEFSSTISHHNPTRTNGPIRNSTDDRESPVLHVPATSITSLEGFTNVVESAYPQVLKSLDLGCCTSSWNPGYLKQMIGGDRLVTVHYSQTAHMDFLEKNFLYKTVTFAEFTDDLQSGKRVYLRSLSAEKPLHRPTTLEEDFPSISKDFKLPPELSYVTINLHSSPLRISGPVNMWLHFDVMANVLCQIHGRKRLVLFSPATVDRLEIPHGASSSQIQVFDDVGQVRPEVTNLDPLICDLEAGDVLFIPALWPHAAYPTDGISIAVNCFFRTLESGYAVGKDTYGNRDIQVYENGRKDIQRIRKSFRTMPPDFKTFYLKRLAAELVSFAQNQ